jgi:multicomponent Na+:H+ antiporter subunit E
VYLRPLRHLALFAALWWLLTGGAPGTWLVGLPTVAAAAWLAGRRAPAASRWSWTGLARFVPFFVWESLRGGLDVTRRILTPSLPLRPGCLEYHCRLADPRAQRLFVGCLSLLPGTLAADLNGPRITVHLLDREQDPLKELKQLEYRVARLFAAPGTRA